MAKGLDEFHAKEVKSYHKLLYNSDVQCNIELPEGPTYKL